MGQMALRCPCSIVPNPYPLRIIGIRSKQNPCYTPARNYWPARLLWEDTTGFIWHIPVGALFTRPAGRQPVPYDWVGRVWYARWYMVEASLVTAREDGLAGSLHHHYCTGGPPGAWQNDVFQLVVLDLDVLIYPDGRHALLDEREFTAHQQRFGYPPATIAGARQAAEDVLTLARTGGALIYWGCFAPLALSCNGPLLASSEICDYHVLSLHHHNTYAQALTDELFRQWVDRVIGVVFPM